MSANIEVAEAGQAGWNLKGHGLFLRACPMCSEMVNRVQHEIPVHVAQFKCPKCDKPSTLEAKVRRLNAKQGAFQFEVVLTCKPCNAKSRIVHVLEKVLGIASLEIGWGAIKVKGSAKQ